MKTCGKCSQSKPLEEFQKNRSRRDGLQSYCRSCGRDRSRTYYAANKTRMKVQIRNANAKTKLRLYTWYIGLFEGRTCKDCGNGNPMVLEYDHTEDDKVANVSSLVALGRSRESILAEIAKCDIVCANCHRIRTHTRSNSFRYRIAG